VLSGTSTSTPCAASRPSSTTPASARSARGPRILESASEKLVQELLPVLDNLDRALESEGDIREGVRATRDQLADVLANEGLLPVASDGQPFDPNVHEAVMGQPSEDHEEGTVLQTFQRGYLLNGRAIRPAKVVVAKQV
jgi:molecular chaperone GrpE